MNILKILSIILSQNISSSWVEIKLQTKNQPSSLLYYEDSYEEDLTLRFGRRSQNISKISQYLF